MSQDPWTKIMVPPSTTPSISPQKGDTSRIHFHIAEGSGPIDVSPPNTADAGCTNISTAPTNPPTTPADTIGVDTVVLRETLRRWFGYGQPRRAIPSAIVDVLEQRRALLVLTPPGASVEQLAEVLRVATDRVVIVGSQGSDEVEAILHVAGHGPLAVIVLSPNAEAPPFTKSGAAYRVVRVPTIAERREDLARLLGDARRHAEGQLGVAHSNIKGDMRALYAHAWPGHLDEIGRVMRMLIAVRSTHSLRRAALVLNMTKSTLASQLQAVGIQTGRSAL